MAIVSHLHQLFNAETCQAYIHALRCKLTVCSSFDSYCLT
jgi:hypothetical protein